MYPVAVSYVGIKLPHHILKRAYKRFKGKPVDPERDEKLWKLADEWVINMTSQEELDEEDLPEEFTMNDLLKAIDDIHGREIAGDVFDATSMSDETEDTCQWVLNNQSEKGFHTTNYHNWVMDAYEAVQKENNKEVSDNDSDSDSVNDDNEHFGVVDITNYIEDKEQGAIHICFTVWSQVEELKKRERGHIFTSCSYEEQQKIIKENLVKVNSLLDKLGITEDEYKRKLEAVTGIFL